MCLSASRLATAPPSPERSAGRWARRAAARSRRCASAGCTSPTLEGAIGEHPPGPERTMRAVQDGHRVASAATSSISLDTRMTQAPSPRAGGGGGRGPVACRAGQPGGGLVEHQISGRMAGRRPGRAAHRRPIGERRSTNASNPRPTASIAQRTRSRTRRARDGAAGRRRCHRRALKELLVGYCITGPRGGGGRRGRSGVRRPCPRTSACPAAGREAVGKGHQGDLPAPPGPPARPPRRARVGRRRGGPSSPGVPGMGMRMCWRETRGSLIAPPRRAAPPRGRGPRWRRSPRGSAGRGAAAPGRSPRPAGA